MSPVERPLRKQLSQDRTAACVWIAVETHIDPFGGCVFDFFEYGSLLIPVARTNGLQVRDLQPATGPARQLQLLIHRFFQVIAVITHVGRVGFAVPRHNTAQPFELLEWRARTRCVHESRRESACPFLKRLGELLFHPVEIPFAERPHTVSHARNAEASVPGQRKHGRRSATSPHGRGMPSRLGHPQSELPQKMPLAKSCSNFKLLGAGYGEKPQLPTTSAVTPCATFSRRFSST